MMAIGIVELLVIIMIVVIFVRSWRAGLLTLLVLFGIVFSFHFVAAPRSRTASIVDDTMSSPIHADYHFSQAPEELPDIWKPSGIADQRPADIYPNPESAARGLAHQLPDQIGQICLENADSSSHLPTRIQIYGSVDNDLLKYDTLQALAQTLETIYQDDVKILLESAVPSSTIRNTDPEALTIRVSCNRTRSTASNGRIIACQGNVMFDLTGPAGKLSRSVPYDYHLWLDNFHQYSTLRNYQQYIITRSSTACASKEEAVQQALDNLSVLLNNNYPGSFELNDFTNRLATDKIEDQFVQRIDGESGPIWRAALLIKNPDQIAPVSVATHQNRAIAMAPWASCLGILFLILVVGLILQYATRMRKKIGGFWVILGLIIPIILLTLFIIRINGSRIHTLF